MPFLRDPYGFTLTRTREHGPVWKTRLLGETVVFFAGPEAYSFLVDPENFVREGGAPPPFLELLHPDTLLFLDGGRHHRRKRQLVEAFTPERIDTYLPGLFTVVERFTDAWANGEARALDGDLRQLAFDLADHLYAGTDPHVSDAARAADLTSFQAGSLGVPVNLPFTRYGRALRARDRLRAHIAAHVDTTADSGEDTVLHVLAASRSATVDPADGALEVDLFGLYFATHSGLTAALGWLLLVLGEQPRLAAGIREEADRILGDGPPTGAQIGALPMTRAVCREVLRAYPVAPPFTMFSRAARDLEFDGHRIPAGCKATGAVWATLQDGSVFADPEVFDGSRLVDAAFDAIPEGAFAATSSGPMVTGHRCAGEGLVHQLLTGFAA